MHTCVPVQTYCIPNLLVGDSAGPALPLTWVMVTPPTHHAIRVALVISAL